MPLTKLTQHFDDSSVYSRLDEIAATGNGKWYFTESEVFIASANTRVLVNAIPELTNIIEHFSFQWAKSVVANDDVDMGETIYSEEREEQILHEDIAIMTKGKLRELFYSVRRRVTDSYNKDCSQASQLQHVQESLAKAASFQITEPDALINEMINCGFFSKGANIALHSAESTLACAIGDYITEHAVSSDFELFLDALRLNLSI